MSSDHPVTFIISTQEGEQQILPDKSHDRYVRAYQKFLQWQKSQNTDSFGEKVLLAYFSESAKTLPPSTLWSIYTMLEPTILANHNVNIRYPSLIAFLQLADCRNKKVNVFTDDEMMKFFIEAPDAKYLAIKVVALFGVFGGCDGDELTNVTVDHVMDCRNGIFLRIPDSKTKKSKKFAIGGVFADTVRKYKKLRPAHIETDRFFIQYRGGKCTVQIIGRTGFAKMPQKIAEFLQLPDAACYTELSFRNERTKIFGDTEVVIETGATSIKEETTTPDATSFQEICLLCLSMRKNTINVYSDHGREMNIFSILATHFWFQPEDHTSHNICSECWKKTQSFHKFYQSIQMAHNVLETAKNTLEDDGVEVPDENLLIERVKIENVTSDGEVYQSVQVPNEITEIVDIESDEDVEVDEEIDQLGQVSDVKDDGEIDQPVHESNFDDDGEIDQVPVQDCIREDEEIESDEDVQLYEEIDQLAQEPDESLRTDLVTIESDEDVDDAKDIDQPIEIVDEDPIADFVEIQSDEDGEYSGTSVCNIAQTNSIETRAFDGLPKEYQDHYLGVYNKFMAWKTSRNIDKECFSEAVVFEYFSYLKTKLQSTELWKQFSLLKTAMQKVHNTFLCYPKVTSLLRDSSPVDEPERPNVFEPDEIRRFFSEAPDIEFLSIKVITIFLMNGVGSDRLTKVEVKDVSEQGSMFAIKFPKKGISSFTVDSEYAAYVRKYTQLRPANVAHDRFFVTYQDGKCTAQPTGRNKFLNAPRSIAQFLKLKNAKSYSTLSFRKESVPNNIGAPHLEENNFKRSTDAVITSTITSSGDTYTISLCEDAEPVAFDLLPESSKNRYLSSYNRFMHWKTDENIDKESFTEAVMMEYFNYLKTKYKPTSLWVEFSTLRTTIQKMNNIDITYAELRAFLKENTSGYQPQKISLFKPDEIRRFLREAEDAEYLAVKVIMIFGIFGVTGELLTKVTLSNVSEQGSVFAVNISDARTNVTRSFTVENEYAHYMRKYMDLRPKSTPHLRFFLQYENGKCSTQPISRDRFLHAPKIIAHFLNLKDAESYSGQSFGRFGKKRKCYRGVRSSNVLDIEECSPSKRKVSDLNVEQINFEPSTESVKSSVDITVANASTNPNTFQTTSQTFHVEAHQVGISTTNMQASDDYVLPDNR